MMTYLVKSVVPFACKNKIIKIIHSMIHFFLDIHVIDIYAIILNTETLTLIILPQYTNVLF